MHLKTPEKTNIRLFFELQFSKVWFTYCKFQAALYILDKKHKLYELFSCTRHYGLMR